MKKFLSILIFIFCCLGVKSQSNDNCENAIFLNDITNYCSGNSFFSNSGSSASGFTNASCWGATATEDVWFTFTAIGTDILISASGAGNGGTMNRPRIALYSGNCLTTINQINCSNGTANTGTTQLYQAALIPGTVYLIRISTTNANEGTFELCVNNYTPSANAGADCGGAAFLCNDNPVSVGSLSGGGLNNDEPEPSTCLENVGSADEGNSSWYYWTAGTSGLFAFDIIPVNPLDDIDFLLYQLSSTNPCGGRTAIRCNASSCLNSNGSTGLNYTDTDVIEDVNCDPGENSYCSAINMVAGTSYALLVNNFSSSTGFTINFNTIASGGSIRGPNPVITTNTTTICAGSQVSFDGLQSTNVSGGLSWNFTNGGTPTSATGTGPHQVTYSSPGNFTAILNGTDANGCQKTESTIIIVNSQPNPPTTSPVTYCQGATATQLTATGSSLLWYNTQTGGIGQSTAPTPLTTTIGTTSYWVSQTVNGCESSRAELVVTINSGPQITQVTNQQVCAGLQTSAINFVVTPQNASIGWSSSQNIGITSPGTGNIPAFTTQNSGSSPIVSQFSAVASVGGCTSQPMDFTITVNPRPNVIASSNSPQCVNSQINFQSSGGVTYSWQGPGAWTSNLQNPQILSATTNQSGTYTVFVTDPNGCSSLATLSVQINPIPQVSGTSNSPVCEGSSINLFADLNNVSSFSWVGPSGFNSNLPSPVITPAMTSSAGTYTLTAQNQFGCVNAAVVNVVVSQSPANPTTSPISYCQDVIANPLFANANGSTTLLWWTTQTGGTSQSSITPQTTTPGVTTYYVSGSNGGCESGRTPLQVTVLNKPNGVIGSIDPKCQPLCSWIRLSSSNSITNWNWDIGFGPVTGNNRDSIYNCYSEPGQYTVKVSLVDANGCTNNLVFPNWVVVYENPTASFFVNQSETTIIDPNIVFTSNSVGANLLNWNFGDGEGLTSNVSTTTHTYSTLGTYTITLLTTSQNLCTDTATGTISIVEDINIFIPNSFSPNGDGVNDEFFPTGTGISKENYSMEIYNRWGEMIFSTTDLSEHWKGNNSVTTLQDTFVYKINLKTIKGNKIVRTGTVTLIR